MTLSRCQLCGVYVPNDKDGKAAHFKRFHKIIAQPLVPLAPAEKAAIVERVEARLGLRHFITPEPLPIPVTHKYKCNRCGPTNNEGYWLMDGTGICEPCVKREAGTIEADEIDTEINYHD